jgi:putative MATE family efflux protein
MFKFSAEKQEVWRLAWPILLGMASQNLLNLVDAWLMGGLGPAVLAGAGMANFLNFMAVAGITGLSSAVQAIAARRVGEGKQNEAAVPLNGGLYFALVLGIPISLLAIFAAPWVMDLLLDDAAAVEATSPYLQWRLAGVVAVGMNFSFRGYWSAVKRSDIYMLTLLVMHLSNTVLSYALIHGHFGLPAMGAAGAGVGTTVSIWLGTILYFWHGQRAARQDGFLRSLPTREERGKLLSLALPSCIQQVFFAAGFTALFWIIGQIGTAELAVANILVTITLVSVLISMAFGISASTLVGQALGRGDSEAARRWGWKVYVEALPLLGGMALVLLLFPQAILGVFLKDPNGHTADLIELGLWPLRLVGLGLLVDSLGMILMNALLGVGAAKLVMQISVGLQWFLFLPAAYLIGPFWGGGLLLVWISMTAYRALQTGLFAYFWQKKGWAGIKV